MDAILINSMLALHAVFSALSLTMSLLLVYLAFRHTPSYFSTFGIMLKFQALMDFIIAIASSANLPRFAIFVAPPKYVLNYMIIFINWTLAIISHGPCQYLGSTACYASFVAFVGGDSCSLYHVFGSFVFRFMAIGGKRPLAIHAIGLICAIALPLPIIFSITFLSMRDDDDAVRRVINALRPDYEADKHLATGVLDIRSVSFAIVFLIEAVYIWPLYAALLYVRNLILTRLEKESAKLSEKSKRLQRKFVKMLSTQATLPVLQLYCIVGVLLEIFDIIRDPLLEISAILVAGTTAFLSPMICLYSIDHYRYFVLGMFGINRESSKVKQVSATTSKQ